MRILDHFATLVICFLFTIIQAKGYTGITQGNDTGNNYNESNYNMINEVL